MIGKENIPSKGIPLIIAGNHQNSLNAPLAIEFAFSDRVVSIFTRADVFKNKYVGKFLRSFYLLPAYRLNMDGEESLKHNYAILEEGGKRLLNGGALAIFPEAMHQEGHSIRPIYRKRMSSLKNTCGMFTVNLALEKDKLPYFNRNIYIHKKGMVWNQADGCPPWRFYNGSQSCEKIIG